MYPAGFAHDNVVQGRAVPVGAGRANRRNQAVSTAADYRVRTESMSSGSRSGGSSPDLDDHSGTSLYLRTSTSTRYTAPRLNRSTRDGLTRRQ